MFVGDRVFVIFVFVTVYTRLDHEVTLDITILTCISVSANVDNGGQDYCY